MSPTQNTGQPSNERINDLYWNGDATVDQIVKDLGITRSAMYSAVQPLPAGQTCDECGERMVYMNRSNRSRGMASCRSCGSEAEVTGGPEAHPELDARQDERADHRWAHVGDGESGWSRWRHDLAQVERGRVALVGGAAALGVAVGAAAVRAWRG